MSKKYPAALYAAAGAGDYAYQQLRKLPTRFGELRDKLATSDLDVDRLRKTARRNAAAALDEARTVYTTLVARGERVVDGRSQRTGVVRRPLAIRRPLAVRRPADDGPAERAPADLAPAEATPAEHAPVEATQAEAAAAPAAPVRPAKRTRPVATK